MNCNYQRWFYNNTCIFYYQIHLSNQRRVKNLTSTGVAVLNYERAGQDYGRLSFISDLLHRETQPT